MSKPALLHFKCQHTRWEVHNLCLMMSEIRTDCNGNHWRLQLSWNEEEDDDDDEDDETALATVGIRSMNNYSFATKFNIALKDTDGTVFEEQDFEYTFKHYDDFMGKQQFDLVKLNDVIKDGRLEIDVTIQVMVPVNCLYQPSNVHTTNMLKLLNSGDNADITFNVYGGLYRAHTLILRANAPILADFCNQRNDNGEVLINDTSYLIFEDVLKYIYAGVLPEDYMIADREKEFIDAANRYGLVGMKMAIENYLVRKCIITKKNVCEYILFADAKTCPLLKEYAVSFFVLHAHEILKSEHSRELRDSAELLTEVMMIASCRNGYSVTVTELRRELGERGLDVDGSKQVLAARLERAKRQRTEE